MNISMEAATEANEYASGLRSGQRIKYANAMQHKRRPPRRKSRKKPAGSEQAGLIALIIQHFAQKGWQSFKDFAVLQSGNIPQDRSNRGPGRA
jgi:hypothetical protein